MWTDNAACASDSLKLAVEKCDHAVWWGENGDTRDAVTSLQEAQNEVERAMRFITRARLEAETKVEVADGR